MIMSEKSILIVEDEPSIAEVVGLNLEAAQVFRCKPQKTAGEPCRCLKKES